MSFSQTQKSLLIGLYHGSTLKVHRYLDGAKVIKLHPLNGPAETINRTTLNLLRLRGLIHSNHKFPAATYVLTETGRRVAASFISDNKMTR